MSETLDSIVAALNERDSSSFGATAKFVIEDEGAVTLDATGARVVEAEAEAEADVTLTASLDTFRAIFDGEMSPTSAFMTGKLRIDGSMGLAMQLASVLG